MKHFRHALFFILFAFLLTPASELWFKEIYFPLGKIKVYKPEVETLSENLMESRSTVILELQGSKAIFGAVWFESSILTDFDSRSITLMDAAITASKYPNLDKNTIETINQAIENDVPKWSLEYSLDEVLARIHYKPDSELDLQNNAPQILLATEPTALILINGKPIFQDLENTNLQFVVNTPFLIVKDKSQNQYYIKGGKYWYQSGDLYKGYHFAKQIPKALLELKNDKNPKDTSSQILSHFIISTEETELIQSNGTPEFAPIANTGLLYMKNTDSDVILNIETQEYFVLLSGRWYKSTELISDTWTFVSPDSLPSDFKNIDESSPVSNLRAHVSGTKEAKAAVLESLIPQTAEIPRTESIEVVYDGKPTFKKIEGTNLLYALNTDKDVLYVNGSFYACENAVWYISKNPQGPWEVSTHRPTGVEDISLQYPIHRVKYVYVYDYTPSTVVVGYYPPYYNSYIYRGTIVYGSGYYYKPWYKNHYYAYPMTYGYGAYYSPYSGWSFSYGLSYGGYYWLHHDDYFYRNYYRGIWGNRGYRYYPNRPSHLDSRRGYHYKNKKNTQVHYKDIVNTPRYKRASSNNLYQNTKQIKKTLPTRNLNTPKTPIQTNKSQNTHRIRLQSTDRPRSSWQGVSPREKTNPQPLISPKKINPFETYTEDRPRPQPNRYEASPNKEPLQTSPRENPRNTENPSNKTQSPSPQRPSTQRPSNNTKSREASSPSPITAPRIDRRGR